MVKISTYVFFDIETTGLPFQEKNRTKITDICFLAVSRNDLITPALPPMKKLSFLLNPEKRVHRDAAMLTGLTNEMLKKAPTFKEKANTIVSFLDNLPKPTCLVAHNGNTFDYKILLAEFYDVNIFLPSDLLCIDSLIGFRKILKTDIPLPVNLNSSTESKEDWPALDVSTEDWEEIDNICASFSNVSMNSDSDKIEDINNSKLEGQSTEDKTKLKKRTKDKAETTPLKIKNGRKKGEFTLTGLYKRLLGKDAMNAHRAEEDCIILLECVQALQDHFISWADESCKKISEIKPLIRY